MAKGDDLEQRLIDFAVRITRLTNALPKGASSRHLGGQLVRSGTSPAFNYGEARAAESGRDFVHKMRVVQKELKETEINLQIILRSELMPAARLEAIVEECDELCRIVNACVRTAIVNQKDTGRVKEWADDYLVAD